MMYMVVKYRKNKKALIIHTCLSRETAQAICQDPGTEGKGGDWFCGFTAQRYKVTTRGGKTLWTNLLLDEAEALQTAKPESRVIQPVTR
jgi:hypothetical protein